VPSEVPHETRLETLGIWPAEALKRLTDAWIVTAEQAVAAAATRGGLDALAAHTGLPRPEVERLVEATEGRLDPAARARFGAPADTSQQGLGAIRPPDRED
jgi:hypothetical protein